MTQKINFKTTGIKSAAAVMERLPNGQYVVHNGWVNGRRTAIYASYIKAEAEAELVNRVEGLAVGWHEGKIG